MPSAVGTSEIPSFEALLLRNECFRFGAKICIDFTSRLEHIKILKAKNFDQLIQRLFSATTVASSKGF